MGWEIDNKRRYRPIEDFMDDDIWMTADGNGIPIIYISDRHLTNLIGFLKLKIAQWEDNYQTFRPTEQQEERLNELRRYLRAMLFEQANRVKSGKQVIEYGNPYYDK